MITEAILRELHEKLPEKLQVAHGKPLCITVTYKDTTGRLEHWVGTNNEFDQANREKTFTHLLGQIKKDVTSNPITMNMHRQFRAKRDQAKRRIRSR